MKWRAESLASSACQDAFRKVAEGDKNAMKNELKKENQQVQDIQNRHQTWQTNKHVDPQTKRQITQKREFAGLGCLCTLTHQQAAEEEGQVLYFLHYGRIMLHGTEVNTLIILDVHARDIVDRFVRDSILSDVSEQNVSKVY